MEPWLSAADKRLAKPRKKQIRVLTVDSDPAFLQAVKTGLPKEWKVHTTSDPGQASTWLQREAFDLAIQGGLSLLREIRVARPEMPTLMTSPYPPSHESLESLRRRRCAYLTKPIDLRELRGLILESLP